MTNDELIARGFPLTWDNTMRVCASRCKRKMYFFLRRFDYRTKPLYFTFGSAWGVMLMKWYEGPREVINKPGTVDYNVRKEACVQLGREYFNNNAWGTDQVHNPNTLETLFRNYLREHPTSQWWLIEGGTEVGFEWPIAGTPYSYAGALDGLIEWPRYGILSLENKTMGDYLGDNVLSRYSFSTQITGQAWYLYQLRGEMPYGVLVNVVTKKIPGPRSNWKTPRTAWLPIRKSKYHLERFIDDLLWDIEDFARCWESWHFPMTADEIECCGGTGKAPCVFKPACLAKGDYRELDMSTFSGIIEKDDRWEPWKRQGED